LPLAAINLRTPTSVPPEERNFLPRDPFEPWERRGQLRLVMQPAQILLMYVVVPLWFCAGMADYLCHRRSDLAHTSGAKESLIHLLMFAEMAVPLLAALLLEINALVFAIMIVAFLAHEVTALWDVSYAKTRRDISPIEQHVHSFLELIPFAAGLLLATLHWPQFLALFGLGDEPSRFVLELKREPLPPMYVVAVLAGAALLEALPYLEELWRALWTNGFRLVPRRR